MVGWWGLYIGLFEGLCLTAGRRQRNGRTAVNQHEVAIHLRIFRRLWDCKQKPRFFHFALGSMLGQVGPGWACLRPILGLCWPYVSPSLAYVGPVLALCWPMLAPCWPILGPMLRLCWRYVRPSLLKDLQDVHFSFQDLSAEPKTT